MDLRALSYFVTVAQELNFSHAAEKLNMSQPPLSNQIRQLEEELGSQLFIRGKRKLTLTDAGRLLYRRATQLLELADTTKQDMLSFGKELTGCISIAMVEGRAPYLVGEWIRGFHEEFPLATFKLWNGSGDDVLDRLAKGLADMAIIAAPFDEEHLEGFTVGREPWVALISREHPLYREDGEVVRLMELSGEPLIIPARHSRQEAIERWFHEKGAQLNVLATNSSYIDAVALVERNAGIALFPHTTYTKSPTFTARMVGSPSKYAEYVLVWNKGRMPIGAAGAFVDFVKDEMDAEAALASGSGENGEEAGDSERQDILRFSIPEDAQLL
ncbi:MAG: LysR family transcriptional regulator [Lachnospiraceae bacterium]|nr:LysR family transcriptional regulator [Lachnospiraceae bacterium]